MKTVNPSISIIVPVYKVEKYLNRCLDSIIAQTFTDWECILIDDGSPDNSGEICDDYAKKDERFVVIHQENAGVSAARNAGLDITKGEYITFVDSDDWVENSFLQEQYSDIVSDDYDVCICGFVGNKKKRYQILNCFEAKTKLFEEEGTGGYSVLRLIKKEIINNVRYNTSIYYLEDTDFFYRLYNNCTKILWTDKPLYNYFDNENSVTREKGITSHKLSMFDTIDKLCNNEQNRRLQREIYDCSLRLRIYECINSIKTDAYHNTEFEKQKKIILKRLIYILFSMKFNLKNKILSYILCTRKNYKKTVVLQYLKKRGKYNDT